MMSRLGRLWESVIFRLFAVYFRFDVIFTQFLHLTECVKPNINIV